MASPSFEYFRSSFDNVFQILPQGHEKALKKALYNTAANFFVIFASLVLVAVYFVLQAFLRPLLWAVLCGTFLYPFKRTLTSVLRSWLQGLHESGTPFAAGVVLIPIKSVNDISEIISNTLIKHFKLIIVGAVGLPCLNLLYYFGPIDSIFSWIYNFFSFLYNVIQCFSSGWVWTVLLGYVIMIALYWKPENNNQLQYLSIPVWVLFVLHLCSSAGSLSAPIFILAVAMLAIGYVSEVNQAKAEKGEISDKEPSDSPMYAAFAMLTTPKSTPTLQRRTPIEELPTEGTSTEASGSGDTKASKAKSLSVASQPPHQERKKVKTNQHRSLSDQCFIALFWAFVLVRLWMHAWILLLIPIPVLFMIFKKLLKRFNCKFGCIRECCNNWFQARRDVLFPAPVRGVMKLLSNADRKLISILEQSLDSATSVLFIFILLFGTALFTVFFVFQVHQESMHLVQVTSNVLNKSVNPEISQWLPNGNAMQKAMDSMVANAYFYGRDWIASKIRDAVQGRGGNNTHIEKEVLEVWDRLYKSWFDRNNTNLVDKPEILAGGNLTALWSLASKRSGFVITDVINFAKSNIGTLMSKSSSDKLEAARLKQVLESVWLVLKGNVNLAFSFVTAVLSLLFGGGTALLNFIISAAIFLTTLFYLLASSGDQYKPVQWFTAFGSPIQGGNNIGQAVEDAVGGVFMASLKMAAFYGLYTWLTHTIFSVNIVFIPSALAAVFGAIPFLGTYWAAVPAVLELWLVNREGLQAILLIVAHLLPTSVVDTAIYSEIKGGHPYMTGLSIAGGIYCLGLEGALIGPIVLCFLVAAISIYGKLLQGGSSQPEAGTTRPSGTLSDSCGLSRIASSSIGNSPNSPVTGILVPWPPELQLRRSFSTDPVMAYKSN
ncbi:transmembrane protein 245 isoform X2 [Octopus bimaculoides]|uniref:transmembrane protein 245 isoform X2 n=1 Tax=Octopus bimaculoides TaxID=37653 RepID=UPI0022E91AD2|nr:transmembrane protein 245 isoform X2 [Octopus bimaculoides]